MCGIAAIFNYRTGQSVDRGEMKRMLDQMQRRGPDGCGDWYGLEGAVGLGHRRLSIIDLSNAGAQPMASADGQIIVTFNGEIYNYRELRAELEAKGRRFRSQSDTEVLLHLYELEGEAMLGKLRGMYAFAIWDERRRSLFLARDVFGIKPLYYSDDGQTIRMASQVKALLAGAHSDTSPESAGHVGFFLWGHIPAPYTLYKGIRALPAGSFLWVDRNGPGEIKEFLSVTSILAAAGQSAAQPSAINPQRAELLRSALTDTVRHHLIADVPVGVFLSSGLDSSTLTALAAENSASLRTVTLGFQEFRGTPDDETPLAEQVAAHYGARHQTIWVSKQDFQDSFPRLMQAMDQPSCDGVNSFFISHAAAQAGLKVALSGLGGDELFGGYPSFRQIPRTVRLLKRFNAPTLHRFSAAFRLVSAPLLKRMTSPKYAGLLEYGGTYGGAFLLRRGMFMPWELPDVLDADLVRDGWERLQLLTRLDETAQGIESPHLRVAALEMTWYMRGQLLRDIDWASMDHSLEVRTPLVDAELVGKLAPLLAAETPPTKREMALSPLSPLPARILDRPKTGFTVPVRQWLVQEDTSFQLDRGLRGWTRLVYSAFMADRRESLYLTRAALRRGAIPSGPRSRRRGVAPKRILVFRIGQLGDTIAALPALWALKKHFPEAELTLLCDRHPGKPYVLGPSLFGESGFFKQFEFYPVREGRMGRLQQDWDKLQLLARLRKARFNALAYLSPSARTRRQVARDLRFFRAAGINNFIGTEGFASPPPRTPGRLLDEVPHEAELLLARLAASGIPVPPPDRGCMDLRLGLEEETELRGWLRPLPEDGGRPWIGFGPGSKMPAKQWPWDRFLDVGNRLIEKFDLWPVVFGGAEDNDSAARLLEQWGRGYNAAGGLSVRAAALALKQCLLYIGNDTGTMHLAAAVGTRCVAIFSARDWPGRWYPYGKGHKVFRAQIPCAGCGLVECVERKNECLRLIPASAVTEACETALHDLIKRPALAQATV
jgi:asparagine synthase (glutamine-hydrolysing)